MQTEKVTELAQLHQRKQELNGELKNVEKKIGELEGILLEEAMQEGISKMTVSVKDETGNFANRTVYLERKIWAGHNGDLENFLQALKESGLAEYVKPNYNRNSISAMVREYDPDSNLSAEQIAEKLPEPLKNSIKITEDYKLKSRRS